jgi:hypothetical protein
MLSTFKGPLINLKVPLYFACSTVGAIVASLLWHYLNENIAYLVAFIFPVFAVALLARRQKRRPIATNLLILQSMLSGMWFVSTIWFMVLTFRKYAH